MINISVVAKEYLQILEDRLPGVYTAGRFDPAACMLRVMLIKGAVVAHPRDHAKNGTATFHDVPFETLTPAVWTGSIDRIVDEHHQGLSDASASSWYQENS